MSGLAIYLPTVVFVSLLGGFLPLMRALSQRALALLLSFSAGVLLGAVFFHMLPETGKVLGENVGLPVLAGFLLIFYALPIGITLFLSVGSDQALSDFVDIATDFTTRIVSS